jgi:fucose 4-O-acetylase-like acetyltransferase
MKSQPTSVAPTGKIEWINLLRIIAMFLVIAGHATYNTIYTPYGGMSHPSPSALCLTESRLLILTSFIYTFHMPLFIAISGACFSLSFHKISSLKALFVKKYKRLIIPFLLTTTFVAIPTKFISGYYSESTNIIKDMILGQYLIMGNTHLWYCVALFFCFPAFMLIEPIHRKCPIIFWALLIILKYISYIMPSNVLAIQDMFGKLIFFAVGFYGLRYINDVKPTLLKVIGLFVLQLLIFYNSFRFWPFGLYGSGLFGLLAAVCGIVAFCMLSKWILTLPQNICRFISNSKLYHFMDKYNYELYLFGDPINYVLVAIFFSIPGFDLFTNDVHSIIAFVSRIIASFVFSGFVILLRNSILKLWHSKLTIWQH